jgi:Domain of unknown function (DUF4381)
MMTATSNAQRPASNVRWLAAITPDPAADPLAGLRDNAATVAVPWPAWVWWAIIGGSVVLIALLAWFAVWYARHRRKEPPPTPREIARLALDGLHARAEKAESYEFSVAVSDVLRTYVSSQYSLHATRQTSPEFLASIAGSPQFTADDRALLAAFLERCDLLKFARIEGRSAENYELLRAAAAFVEGRRVESNA